MKKTLKKKGTPQSSRNFFDSPDHPYFRLVNGILTLTIIVSIAAAVLETVDSLTRFRQLFALTEYTAVAIFILEYIARIKFAKKPLRYICSFFGIIDLLAIIPTLLGLADFTFLKIIRIIRMLHLLRMTHVAKFADNKHKQTKVESLFLFHLEIWLATVTFAILTLGTVLYIFEDTNAPSIPAGMLWVLASIGGVNHLQPETTFGSYTLIATHVLAAGLFGTILLLTGTMIWKSVQVTK
jgi:voltage-gated potassium channel